MKSVLMIARDFPPEGNAGAYRPLRFVRHLPSFGWHPTVITIQKESYERFDLTLVDQVPANVPVVRVRNRDPWQKFLTKRSRQTQTKLSHASPVEAARIIESHHGHLRSKARELIRSVEAWIYHPDIDMGWIAPAVKAIVTLCAQKPPDVLWATAGPVSSFHIAHKASQRTGIPYVLDFRDAWTITFNEFEDRRPKWAKRLDHGSMYSLIKGARAVVFRYETEAECYWRAYQGAVEPAKIRIIPNGFEGDVEPFIGSANQKCTFLYTGTVSDYRYDTLLAAIRAIKTSFPEDADQLHFHFVGEGRQAIKDQSHDLDLDDLIATQDAIPQSAVADLTRRADVLLLLGRYRSMRGYELFAAAKLFGYLKAGKPIVGVLPPDEAKRILETVGVSTLGDVESVEDIVGLLRRVLRCWKDGSLAALLPNANVCRMYSAQRQTGTLVSALEDIQPSECFVPGRAGIPDSLGEQISWKEALSRRIEKPHCQPGADESHGQSGVFLPRSHNKLN